MGLQEISSSDLAMGFPRVEKACLVFDLKTGTIILGVLNLILCIIGTIACLAVLVGYSVASDEVFDAVVEQHPEVGDLDGDVSEAIGIVVYVTVAIALAICVFYIIIASLLIHGARKGRPGFLTPWLVLTVISMLLQILEVISSLAFLEWGDVFGTLVALIIEAYLFSCVYSLKKQLEDEGGNMMPM